MLETPTPDEQQASPQSATPPAGPARLRRIFRNREFESSLSFLGFVVIFIAFAIWLGHLFLNVDSRLLDVHQDVPVLLLGFAVLVTLSAGLFDLSVASMATLTTTLTIGLVVKNGWPFGLVLVTCLVIGMVGGLINGLLVEKVGVNTFIATLGTGGVFAGLSAVYSGGTNITPATTGSQLPTWFGNLGSVTSKPPSFILTIFTVAAFLGLFGALGRLRPRAISDRSWLIVRAAVVVAVALFLILVLSLPQWISHSSWTILVLIITATVVWVILELTSYGRYIHAIGSNRVAARLAGVRVEREVIKAFGLGGLLSALSGIILAAAQGAAAPDAAVSFLLPAFAAAFVSTVIFSRGRFTVWGTIVGGIFIVWIAEGLIVGGLSPTWTAVVNGIVLVAAVSLATVTRVRG